MHAQTEPRSLGLSLEPYVVGTIITPEYLEAWSKNPQRLPCDLVELRVDGFSDFDRWLEIGSQIQKMGMPVIATVRYAQEGGKWAGNERDRFNLLESAAEELNAIDVELHSEIAIPLSKLTRSLGKLCILSFHDFQKTPPRDELEAILHQMETLGSIGKIAAAANSEQDVETLRSLLRQKWKVPICVIGMGSHGRETRLQFPREGSCLTYGYLDVPGAPGQYSARELRDHFPNV